MAKGLKDGQVEYCNYCKINSDDYADWFSWVNIYDIPKFVCRDCFGLYAKDRDERHRRIGIAASMVYHMPEYKEFADRLDEAENHLEEARNDKSWDPPNCYDGYSRTDTASYHRFYLELEIYQRLLKDGVRIWTT